MKKAFLYLLTAIMSITTFSSCLGDNESTSSQDNAYCIIASEGGMNYAKLFYLELTNEDQFKEYESGDVMFINYKINYSSFITIPGTTTQIFKADYAAPTSENYVFRRSEHLNVNYEPVNLEPENPNAFTSFRLEGNGHLASKYFSDRWLIYHQAKYTKEQTATIELFYDEDQQFDADGKELPENTHIIDVKLNISGTPNSSSEATNKEQYVVVDMSRLRTTFYPVEIDEEKGTLVKIIFRYFKENTSGSPTLTLYDPGNNAGINYYIEK
ncbi:MAG: hypothetical protein E6772_15080 [Dysgonomonas sp.]|nr:hypothetical protein [Dysgonomonas sp.]